MDYINLISLNFNDKESVMLFLNEWYIKKLIKEDYYEEWANDLMDFYTLAKKHLKIHH